MAERKVPIRVEQRTISGKGVFVLEPDKNIRELYLYLQVVRLPRINFTNSKYNPDKSEYAKITWSRRDYILRETVLHFERELHTWEQDPIGYLAYSNVCMYNSIIAYFDYLAIRLSIPPLARTNDLYTEPRQNLPDRIRIVCRDDTAIIADLWKYEYDLSCPQADSDSPPPPDPPPVDKVPPGTPIADISPPYTPPNDNGDTVPNPSDDIAPPVDPPQGDPCTIINVNWEWTDLADIVHEVTTTVIAPYYSIGVLRQGTVGVDYTEGVIMTVTTQQFDSCNEGNKESFNTGVGGTVPNIKSVTFLSISVP